jgi:hypothetical protein
MKKQCISDSNNKLCFREVFRKLPQVGMATLAVGLDYVFISNKMIRLTG